MAKKSGDVHVVRNPKGNWDVKQDGDRLSTHQTQANAIERGKGEAKRDGVDLVTHGRDGKIRSKDSYGHDPNPPKDREH
jgi:hypothetical protein